MASALPALDISGLCSNCFLFNWKQPENPKSLRKCTRCYVVAYCGRECQEEHWQKVHKNHCKYLGGLKKAKHSEHNKETCRTCIASDSVGDLVFSRNNPDYVCIFEHIDWKMLPPTFPHPFPLNGPPEDRIEKMLNATQRILLKLKVTENPVYLLQSQQVDELEKDLWDLRGKLYFIRICGRDQDPVMMMGYMAYVFDFKSTSPWKAIAEKADCYFDQMHRDNYKLLATLALLIPLTRSTILLLLEKALKSSSSLPRDFRQMSKADQFFRVADKILEALDQKVVPFSALAAIACQGKTEQNCSQCHKEIAIQGIYLNDLSVRGPVAEIIFNAVENQRYICESPECFEKESPWKADKFSSWLMAVSATYNRLNGTRCDHCYLLAPLNEVHRSRCLTKNYCSQGCRDADDSVHKVCCNPDKGQRCIEERKVKIGGQDKVETANAKADSFGKLLSLLSSLTAHDPEEVKLTEEVMGKIKKKKKN